MASFASSATTGGARNHAWTKKGMLFRRMQVTDSGKTHNMDERGTLHNTHVRTMQMNRSIIYTDILLALPFHALMLSREPDP